jgi:hypothetical protein
MLPAGTFEISPFCGNIVIECQSRSTCSLAKYERKLTRVHIFPISLVINPYSLQFFFAGIEIP